MRPANGASHPRAPLERVTSIKLKLGLLVVASVSVATILATVGADSVPAVLGIPVTVLLALGVTQLLAVGMTQPLRQMTEAARRMAAGDYAVRIETDSSDEVGELARAFNRMAADLAAVDRQRRELVANVSHELRTPLAALIAVLENLDDGVGEPDPRTISVALGQADRLSALVHDLLDLSRVDAGIVALDLREVAVGDLVAEAVAEASAGPRTVRFEVRVEPTDLVVRADRARLHQLLANLLENAARHGPSGGVVRVWAGRVGTTVRLEVADEGPGIDPEERVRVFERFGTGPDGSGGGTGLGLAIARWVADLHGGRIAAVDPVAGESGARLRVDLPALGQPVPHIPRPTHAAADSSIERSSTTSPPTPPPPGAIPPHAAQPGASPGASLPGASLPGASLPGASLPPAGRATGPHSTSLVEDAFGTLWPDPGTGGRRGVLLASMGIGVFAGLTVPFSGAGLAAAMVLLASGTLVLWLSARRTWFTWACAAVAAVFASIVVLRAAEWVVVLGLLTSAMLVTSALTDARSVRGMLVGTLAWPFAGLRGVPWLGRTLRAFGGGNNAAAVARTIAVSASAVLVFGALFASGDAIFGQWIRVVVPDLPGAMVLRIFVMVAVGGIVLAASYLALNPPPVEGPDVRRPAQHRFEWLAPVLLVDAVFVLFLAAQAAAFFGGHDYVRGVTGLTYADYVHQGFAQLTVATALTLLVVWAAVHRAGRTVGDRLWLRASLGALCGLTLVVVASALHRMDLYQEAYGFTRLRLLVDLFELWLGLVVAGVLAAGIRLRGRWLPRAALLSGAVLLLGLAIANPDAWIARQNVERYEATGKVDWFYLQNLSADAIPTLAGLPAGDAACAMPREVVRTGWTGWNLARVRALEVLDAVDLSDRTVCLESGSPVR